MVDGFLGALRRAAVGLCATALVAGCAGGAGTSDGRLTFAISASPDCLDPQVSQQDAVATIDRNLFDSLIAAAPDGSLHPWLATSWSTAPDGLSYTFRLRPGVTFHDGTALDARAVATTLDHTVDPATKSKYAASLIDAYAGSDVLDPMTIRVRLSHPSGPFLQALSTAYLGIQSPRAIRDDPRGRCSHPVGSGPFVFTGWARNSAITMDRNPAYEWGPATAAHTGPARLTGITISLISEDASRYGALVSGQADVIGEVPPPDAANLSRVPDLHLTRTDQPGVVQTALLNSVSGVLADERVRSAFVRSVDLDKLVPAVSFGQYRRAWGMLGTSGLGADPGLAGSWPYDPSAAAGLLDAAGWTGRDAEGYRTKDGRRLTVVWPYSTAHQQNMVVMAQGIQADARRAGIRVDYTGLDTGTFGDVIEQRRLDMYATSFVRADPDIMAYFLQSSRTSEKGGGNVFGLADPALDRMLGAGYSTLDPARRAQDYTSAQRYVAEHALVLPIYVPASLVGSQDRVRGLTVDAVGSPQFYDVWLEDR